MGVESANYHYVPTADGSAKLAVTLDRLGARRRPSDSGRFCHYVLSGVDHWIDLEVGLTGGLSYPSVEIRVALCNPAPTLEVLHRLLATLLLEGGGYLMDRTGDQRLTQLDDDAWMRLRTAYEAKRDDFRERFGSFEAPISGEDVFKRMRESSG